MFPPRSHRTLRINYSMYFFFPILFLCRKTRKSARTLAMPFFLVGTLARELVVAALVAARRQVKILLSTRAALLHAIALLTAAMYAVPHATSLMKMVRSSLVHPAASLAQRFATIASVAKRAVLLACPAQSHVAGGAFIKVLACCPVVLLAFVFLATSAARSSSLVGTAARPSAARTALIRPAASFAAINR